MPAEFITFLAAARLRIASGLSHAPALLRQLGPYAAIELVLPGGSLLALLLWLCRRRSTAAATG